MFSKSIIKVSLSLLPVNVVDYGGLLEARDPEGRAGDEEGAVDLVRPLLHLLEHALLVDLGYHVEELEERTHRLSLVT